MREGQYYNPYFPGGAISMAQALYNEVCSNPLAFDLFMAQPHPLLRAGSQAACEKITISGIPYCQIVV
jgi:hypothetical protein